MSCIVQCRKELGTIADLIRNEEWRPVPVIGQQADIIEMRRLFCGGSAPRRLYVVDSSSTLLGVVCIEDILKYSLFYHHDPYSHVANLAQLALAESAAGFMRSMPVVHSSDDLVDALEKMLEGSLPEIAVVTKEGKFLGVLSLVDILRVYHDGAGECREACGR